MEHPSQSTDEMLEQDHKQQFLIPNDDNVRRAWHMATRSYAYAKDVGLCVHDKNGVPATLGTNAHIFKDGEFADNQNMDAVENWMNVMAGMAAQRASLKALENELTKLQSSMSALFAHLTSHLEPWYEALTIQDHMFLQEHNSSPDTLTVYAVFKEQSEKCLDEQKYLSAVRLAARGVEHLHVEFGKGLEKVREEGEDESDEMDLMG